MKRRIEYLSALLSIFFLRSLPLTVSNRVGAFLGKLFYLLDVRHRKIALSNLRSAFGKEKNEKELKKIALGSFENLGRSVSEFVRIPTLDPSKIQASIQIEGLEHYWAARKQGKGVIFLTAHFGNWEWMAVAFSTYGYPLHVVARPLDNPYLNKMIQKWRERYGTIVLNKKAAAAEIVHLLRKGATVGFLLDQNTARSEAVFVDYFGRPAATHKGLAILALRTGAPVLPAFTIRTETGHRIIVEKELNVVRTGALQNDILLTTALFTKKIESYVRQYPDHWLWVHRRWKTEPLK